MNQQLVTDTKWYLHYKRNLQTCANKNNTKLGLTGQKEVKLGVIYIINGLMK